MIVDVVHVERIVLLEAGLVVRLAAAEQVTVKSH
jgi:hypothetical protein